MNKRKRFGLGRWLNTFFNFPVVGRGNSPRKTGIPRITTQDIVLSLCIFGNTSFEKYWNISFFLLFLFDIHSLQKLGHQKNFWSFFVIFNKLYSAKNYRRTIKKTILRPKVSSIVCQNWKMFIVTVTYWEIIRKPGKEKFPKLLLDRRFNNLVTEAKMALLILIIN